MKLVMDGGGMERGVFERYKTGEIIKQYKDDKPLPSCLILERLHNG